MFDRTGRKKKELFVGLTPEDMRRVMILAKGGDPDAQQIINDFMRFDSNLERTNLPQRKDVVLMAYLDGCSKLLYPDRTDNPFALLGDSLAISFMAKGGDKSKQTVDLLRQSPDLSQFQTSLGMKDQRSLTDKVLRRGQTE